MSDMARQQEVDAELEEIARAWPTLAEPLKAAVLAMLRVAVAERDE